MRGQAQERATALSDLLASRVHSRSAAIAGAGDDWKSGGSQLKDSLSHLFTRP